MSSNTIQAGARRPIETSSRQHVTGPDRLAASHFTSPQAGGEDSLKIPARRNALRLLRLAEVKNVTGLGKTKLYELQAEGSFPMRIKITGRLVGWVEEDVQTWLAQRVAENVPLREL